MPRVNSRAECKPVRDPWQDDVNGSIISGEDEHEGQTRYAFYDVGQGGRIITADMWFANEAEALAWVESYLLSNYLRYPAGVEMRCYFD